MARHTKGWVKLYRSIDVSDIGDDGYAFCIFMKLVMWASTKETKCRGVVLQRGDLITSIKEIEDQTGFSEATIRRRIAKLIAVGMVTRPLSDNLNFFRVVNYDTYQKSEIGTRLKSDGNEIEMRLARDTHSKKEERRKKKEIYTPPKQSLRGTPVSSEFDLKLASDWIEFAKSKTPSIKANKEKCADEIRKLREIDGLSEALLQSMLDFVKQDTFWVRNALSPASLRINGKNGLRKFENILNAMESRPKQQPKNELFPDEISNRLHLIKSGGF